MINILDEKPFSSKKTRGKFKIPKYMTLEL